MKLKTTLEILKPVLLVLFIALLATGCNDEQTPETEVETEVFTEPSAQEVHVAYAGGGWRAHTGHAAWIISLLQNGTISLDDAFDNVGVIGSNSGGSWFNTMLAMSEDFATQIQADSAHENWVKTGWIGQQQDLFQHTKDCDGTFDKWYGYTLCIMDKHDNDTYNWATLIDSVVYKEYPIGEATLSESRNTWASDKTLLVAASLLTPNVLLNDYGKDLFDDGREKYQYYMACHSPSSPDLGTFRLAADCENRTRPYHEVSPVIFSGLPATSSDKIPPLLPALGSDDHFTIGYSEVILDDDPNHKEAALTNSVNCKTTPAIQAATASSAALGFEAYVRSLDLKWWWAEAYGARDFAPSFSFKGSAKFKKADSLTVDELASEVIVRLADGGPLDNSGVAQIVKYLQLNGKPDGFNIIAFDNVMSAFPGDDSETHANAKVGPDIANLFGAALCGEDSNEFCFVGCGIEEVLGCVEVPKLQIFELDSLLNQNHTWRVDSAGMQLIYTQYSVSTVDNSYFGIEGNHKGTLHAFTCVAPDAKTAPTSSDFTPYFDMFNFIYNALNADSGAKLEDLKNAFNL